MLKVSHKNTILQIKMNSVKLSGGSGFSNELKHIKELEAPFLVDMLDNKVPEVKIPLENRLI